MTGRWMDLRLIQLVGRRLTLCQSETCAMCFPSAGNGYTRSTKRERSSRSLFSTQLWLAKQSNGLLQRRDARGPQGQRSCFNTPKLVR